ncbi:hypothetical protein LXL04_025484 [Taraxacum kok-saghyz]
MGCCLSTPTTANKTAHRRLDEDSKSRMEPRHATPSPPFEKETVKEVLSETPTPISIPVIQDTTEILQENDAPGKLTQENQENVTEMSEITAYLLPLSGESRTRNHVLTDTKRDVVEVEDDGEVTQKISGCPPPPKKVRRRRPERFSGEISRKTMQTTQRHGNVGPSDVVWRGLPAKRSRSPAIRGQSLNMRERFPAPEKNSGEERRGKSAEIERKVKVVKVGVPSEPEIRESLENPVISLECFIFL